MQISWQRFFFFDREVNRDRQRGTLSFPDQVGAAGYSQTHTTEYITAGEHYSNITVAFVQ